MSNLGTKLDGSTFPSGDDVGAVVIDLGSLYIQAGNAGDEWPKHFSESFIGEDRTALSEDTDMNAEEPARKKRRKPALKYPLFFSTLRNNTEVRPCLYRRSKRFLAGLPSLDEVLTPPEPLELDRDVFETIVDRIFNVDDGKLRVDLKDRPVMLSEPNKHNRSIRESMAEVLFESFDVEALYTAKRAVLTSVSVGRTGGLIVDIGSSTTTITPVVDGYTLQKNVRELPIGGDLLDCQLTYLLKQMGLESKIVPLFSVKKKIKLAPNLPPSIESVESISTPECHPSYYNYRATLRSMKESVCRIVDDPLPPPPANIVLGLPKHSSSLFKYELPDGTPVNTEQISRSVPECLFNFKWIFGLSQESPLPQSLLGATSLPSAVAQCALSCDVDSRRDLLSALTFVGGCALLPGFTDRITRQFQDAEGLLGSGLKYKIICPISTTERRFSSWIGGSILASLGSFQQLWMSRAEYGELGAQLLERRCIQ